MGFSDTADRAGIIASMDNVLSFQALFFRHFAPPVEEQFGQEGEAAVTAAMRRYGRWRGEQMAARHQARGIPLNAESLVLYWDMGDWHCFGELGAGSASGNPRQARVTMAATPMWDDFQSKDLAPLARRYYTSVYPGIADGYGAQVEIPSNGPDLVSPWTVTWTCADLPVGTDRELRSSALEDQEETIAVLRWSAQLNAALYYFVADETTRRFDMAGEAVMRESVRNLARERAAAQRVKHTAQGLPLDLVTLQNHWDGDFVSLWKFDEGVLTPGTWHQDCIACPYFDTWESFGSRGMALGYIYDYELHPTLYQAYHPDAVVQFEAIKTRGDAICAFRVSIPTLQEDGEPHFAGYTGRDV
jgi:hypothetical protein